MLSIFVSYSHEDAALVTPVVRLLRATEGLVFQDSDSIGPGKRWRQELDAALVGADLIVVFWCRHSSRSAEVRREYAAAITAGKNVLPVLLDSTPVPENLSEFQWVDFRELAGDGHASAWNSVRQLPKRYLFAGLIALLVLAALDFSVANLDHHAYSRPFGASLTVWLLSGVAVLALILLIVEARRPREAASKQQLRMAEGLRAELLGLTSKAIRS
jgi:hypothetical protein